MTCLLCVLTDELLRCVLFAEAGNIWKVNRGRNALTGVLIRPRQIESLVEAHKLLPLVGNDAVSDTTTSGSFSHRCGYLYLPLDTRLKWKTRVRTMHFGRWRTDPDDRMTLMFYLQSFVPESHPG